jgi:hypothetical protein
MEDEDEINIKLELSKDKNQNLSILTYFNPNSSNFFKEGDYYIWKPTLKEKEFIIDAFRLIINSNSEKNEGENIFKFSDKISEINKQSKEINNLHSGSNETNEEEIIKNQEKTTSKHENIINETVNKNKIKENKLFEDERERKIEKILRDNKKIEY